MPPLRPRFLLPALFVLAFCVRGPLLELPLTGEGARLASVAARWAQGSAATPDGAAPLVPALASLGVRAGLDPTTALRLVDALAAALLAPLVLLLGLRLGLAPGRAGLAGLLMALHPLALAGEGGVGAGSASWAAALLLGALAGASASGARGRRAGAGAALLLLVADPWGLLLAPASLALHLRREPSPRWQTAGALVGAGLGLYALLAGWGLPSGAAPGAGTVVAWLACASLGVLAVGLPTGLRALWRRTPEGRHLLLAVAGLGLGAVLGLTVPLLAVLAAVLLCGAAGRPRLLETRGRRLLPAAAGGALLASLWLVSGSLQATLQPSSPGPAGRLHQLRVAMRSAARTAGDRGWIVLAVAGDRPDEQASLADLVPGHWAWTERGSEEAGGVRPLRVFPAAAFESGRSVAVVAGPERQGGIHTFGGAGIYQEEVVREVGPYVVLRARRP